MKRALYYIGWLAWFIVIAIPLVLVILKPQPLHAELVLDPLMRWRHVAFIIGAIGVFVGLIAGLNSLVGVYRDRGITPHQWWKNTVATITNSQQALLIGGSISAVASAIHLAYTSSGPVHEQYDTIIGIYIATTTASLGVKAFFGRIVPITDVNLLLKRLTADLGNCNQGELWIAYPALNIGYYRNYVIEGDKPQIIENFTLGLQQCASKLTARAHVITYPANLYRPLYECYITSQNNNKRKRQINDHTHAIDTCSNNAQNMLAKFSQAIGEGEGHLIINSAPLNVQDNVHESEPQAFPPHVILIGDIVYVLSSYGFPVYNPQTKTFTALPEEHDLIEVLAYRREDPALAHMISNHLRHLFCAATEAKMQPATEAEQARQQALGAEAAAGGGNHE